MFSRIPSLQRKVLVLVVDDDPFYAETAAAILALDESIEVVGRAADGREGIRLALTLEPDVVVMDIRMPVLDGFEATRRLRRLLPATEVVILTSLQGPRERARAGEVGAAAFLQKDTAARDLADVVVDAATRSRRWRCCA